MGILKMQRRNRDNVPWRLRFFFSNTTERNHAREYLGYGESKEFLSYPLDINVVSWFREHLPYIDIDEDVREWVNQRLRIVELAKEQKKAKTRRTDLPLPYASKLYDYQTTGAKWLATIKRGILADEPGLGKTLQALAACDLVKADKILVLTVNETVQRQWEDTIIKWELGSCSVMAGTKAQRFAALFKRTRFTIAPISILSARKSKKHGTAVNPFAGMFAEHWDVIIIDEAHMLQGRDSSRGERATKFLCNHIFLLTGTPIWNRPESLFNLLKIVNKAKYPSFWSWVDTYFKVDTGSPFGRQIKGYRPGMEEALKKDVSEIILRRTMDEVIDEVPEVQFTKLEWEPSTEQRRILKAIKEAFQQQKHCTSIVDENNEPVFYIHAIQALVDMRRVLNTPRKFSLKDNPKLAAVRAVVEKYTDLNKQVVIFTWHRDFAYLLEEALEVPAITGDTLQDKRAKIVSNFKLQQTKIIIATMGALGTGVDLPKASAVLFAETDYTPALIEQAWRRIYRVNDISAKNVYFLVAPYTIEERIYSTFIKKEVLSENLLADNYMRVL